MTLNELSLEKKFDLITNSQDSIQSLSLWILHHKLHHKRIIDIWMKCFEKAKPTHRLTLFYLANDVIQHAKRKGFQPYVDDFADILKEATILIKGDKISGSVDRVFNIWLERNVYSEQFIADLKALLSGITTRQANTSKIVAEFKLSEIIDKIRRMRKVEQISSSKLESLSNCVVDATSSDVLNKLKDKTHGEQFSKDFDDATKCLETVITALDKEVLTRNELIESLEKTEIFYETQKDEARIVVNAYKNFSLRVKNVSKKLNESKVSLPSPLPSPPRDAPSPTNSDDGPTLPSDLLTTDMSAFLNVISADEAKSGSSLDQRLSNLIHSIPHMSDKQNNSSRYVPTNTNHSSQSHSQMQISGNNNNGYTEENAIHKNRWNTTEYSVPVHIPNDNNYNVNYKNDIRYVPQGTTSSNNQYNYSHAIGQHNTDIQPIQALVSSREDTNQQLKQLPVSSISSSVSYHEYHPIQPPLENFEPADMDLGNSDEEDIAGVRIQTHRTIKVIDTRRNSSEVQTNDLKVNSETNSERSYGNSISNTSNNSVQYMTPPFALSQPQLKSIALMPVPSRPTLNNSQLYPNQQPMHSQQQWRTPRSAVIAPSNFAPNLLSMNPSGSHPHNRNWRPSSNRNNNPRKSGFRRY